MPRPYYHIGAGALNSHSRNGDESISTPSWREGGERLSVLLRYPALNRQWLCILSFVGLRIVSLEVKKGKKEKKARVFLKSPYSTQPTKPKSSVFKRREGGYVAAGLPSSPGSGEGLIASGKGPG